MPLTVLLRCHDLELTRAHYRDVLGFSVEDSAQGTLTVQLQDCRLLFTVDDLWSAGVGSSGTLYLQISGVDRYFEQVKDQAQIAWPLQDMTYGSREFGVRDCNGYHLAFAQPTSA
ncbi:putative glyoxalase superfamily protein PhnB [Pseudomonas nitritireducens]|uniref:Putative glyoxalase superfamily protein PhnB n=1 Tax=Pseudomonas nitroreducens TaxID=46680 RepID=A0A7W7NZ76_PSENT|nr:bleomycin resistance family protein [Pseudomonas nitritireducens]MBB4862191.1 putative glyoxalase superfamily protein PhnB [Pseudomonas nitritireducens]